MIIFTYLVFDILIFMNSVWNGDNFKIEVVVVVRKILT